MNVRIGTRGSDLALWQARHVRARLEAEPGVTCEIIVLSTRGDRIDDVPLQTVEGKGFFTAEIERALLDREVDLAVHSHKDLAVEDPEGLCVVAVPERAPARERLLVRPEAFAPDAPGLPLVDGARLGTSAPRRCEQVQALRPDLQVLDLRGNVPTRVRRLREGRYDAIVLAAAGLDRLELDVSGLCVHELALELFVPAPAQGALAIQARAGDTQLTELCRRRLHDEETARAVAAERQLLVAIGGGCNLPLGAHVARTSASHPPPPTHPGGPIESAPGDTREAVSYRADVFLGADQPHPGARPRWVSTVAGDPRAAIDAAHARLTSDEPTGVGPLAGLRVAITGSGESPSLLGERLTTLGAQVVPERVLEFEALDEAPTHLARLGDLRPGDTVAITSRRAAQALAGWTPAAGVRLAAVGPACARALEAAGLRVDLVGSRGARELAAELALGPDARVLFPCAEGAREELEETLRARGVEVERLPVYRTRAVDRPQLDAAVDARVYMSPSAVQAAGDWEREQADSGVRRLALGDITAEALASASLDAEQPAPAATLQEAAVRHLMNLAPRAIAEPERDTTS